MNSLNEMKSVISTIAEEEVCNPDIASGPFCILNPTGGCLSLSNGGLHKARTSLHCLRSPQAWESAVDCSQQPSGKGWALLPMGQEAGASSLEGSLPDLPPEGATLNSAGRSAGRTRRHPKADTVDKPDARDLFS